VSLVSLSLVEQSPERHVTVQQANGYRGPWLLLKREVAASRTLEQRNVPKVEAGDLYIVKPGGSPCPWSEYELAEQMERLGRAEHPVYEW